MKKIFILLLLLSLAGCVTASHFQLQPAVKNESCNPGPFPEDYEAIIKAYCHTQEYQRTDLLGVGKPGHTVQVKFTTNSKKETKPWIGIEAMDLTPANLSKYNINTGEKEGVLIVQVYKGTGAERAGLIKEDIVKYVDEKDIKNSTELVKEIQKRNAGQTIELGFIRNGKLKAVKVVISERTEVKPIKEPSYLSYKESGETKLICGWPIDVIITEWDWNALSFAGSLDPKHRMPISYTFLINNTRWRSQAGNEGVAVYCPDFQIAHEHYGFARMGFVVTDEQVAVYKQPERRTTVAREQTSQRSQIPGETSPQETNRSPQEPGSWQHPDSKGFEMKGYGLWGYQLVVNESYTIEPWHHQAKFFQVYKPARVRVTLSSIEGFLCTQQQFEAWRASGANPPGPESIGYGSRIVQDVGSGMYAVVILNSDTNNSVSYTIKVELGKL